MVIFDCGIREFFSLFISEGIICDCYYRTNLRALDYLYIIIDDVSPSVDCYFLRASLLETIPIGRNVVRRIILSSSSSSEQLGYVYDRVINSVLL